MDVSSTDKQSFKLHSPTTAVNLSFLLTPIFGSYIQMKNWSKLGQAGKVTQGKVWLIASSVIYIALLTLEMQTAFWLHVLFFVVWYFFFGKDQISYFKEHFKSGYDKQQLAGTALLCAIGLFAFAAFLGMIGSLAGGQNSAGSNVHIASDANGTSDANKICGRFTDAVTNLIDEDVDNARAGIKVLMIKNARLAYASDVDKVYICHGQFINSNTDVAPVYYAQFRGENGEDFVAIQQRLLQVTATIEKMNAKAGILKEEYKIFEPFFKSFTEETPRDEFSFEQRQEKKFMLGEISQSQFYFGVP